MKMRGGTPGSDMYPTDIGELGGKKSETTDHRIRTSNNRTPSTNGHRAFSTNSGANINVHADTGPIPNPNIAAEEGSYADPPQNLEPSAQAHDHIDPDCLHGKQQQGNVYYFSRANETETHQKQTLDDPGATTGSHPEFDADQTPRPDIDLGNAAAKARTDPDEAGFDAGSNGTQTPHDTPDDPYVDWVEHPISKALAVYNEVDSPLNPARIIAESLQPFTAFDGLPVDMDPVRQTEDAEDVPIRPVSPDQAEQAAELEADAIETRDRFWDLWIGHQEQMRNQCIRLMSGNVADAEDALSSAMLRASKKFPSYSENIVNGKAWLRKLVYNVCMDHHRQGKYTEYRAFDLDTDIPATGAMFTGEQQSPEDIALSQEQIRELDTCLDALSGNLRVPLLLRCVEGWSYPDIAKQLNLRADTVRKRIQLARDHLRRNNIR